MIKLSRIYFIGVFIVLALTLFSTSSIALVMTREEGIWPESWPKELELYRKQAKTIELAAGNQENVYEIGFENREEFEKLWPIILKLKDKGAPIRLRSIEKPFKKGGLFNNEKPVVRIYSHVWPAYGTSRPGGKKLIPAPPWPESIKSHTGELPEYIMRSEDGNSWIPVGEKKPKGFMYRARTEIELVIDGTIIDLNRIYLPSNTPIVDKRKLDKKPDVQVEGKIIDKDAPDPNWPHPRSDERIQQRRQMVRLIRNNYGLKDKKILKAMENVPRHWFVPKEKAAFAYTNRPLPIGYDQTISQPFIVAYMTSQLKLDKNKKVLEIGTGSGYQAAVLTEFTPHVYTIEILEPLARATAKRLKELGYTTINTRIGDGYKGWPKHQPFDAIIVTAAPGHIPAALLQQLAPGGRMIIPVGRRSTTQSLILITKDTKGKITKKNLMPVRFVPMVPGNSK